jgi:NAD(P)-dependent dehydrogenase (short-subunit alcohol dehydrogenase family)
MTATAKWAAVTGGTTGIGYEIAISLARTGWDVAVSCLEHDARAAQMAGEIAAFGRRLSIVRCDAGSREDVERFFDGAQEYFGAAPRLLVNNAGIQTWSPLLDLQESSWDAVIRTNLKGCFLNTQKAARLMIAADRGGAIVNIGSGCGRIPFPNLVDYSASKAGVDQFTRSAAMELGPHGITVNCVSPGAVEIERTRQERPDYAGVWSKITPLRRVATPADIAHAVLFFASEGASFITGQILSVDGGVFIVPNWPY